MAAAIALHWMDRQVHFLQFTTMPGGVYFVDLLEGK
jgi:hypothetical protein